MANAVTSTASFKEWRDNPLSIRPLSRADTKAKEVSRRELGVESPMPASLTTRSIIHMDASRCESVATIRIPSPLASPASSTSTGSLSSSPRDFTRENPLLASLSPKERTVIAHVRESIAEDRALSDAIALGPKELGINPLLVAAFSKVRHGEALTARETAIINEFSTLIGMEGSDVRSTKRGGLKFESAPRPIVNRIATMIVDTGRALGLEIGKTVAVGLAVGLIVAAIPTLAVLLA